MGKIIIGTVAIILIAGSSQVLAWQAKTYYASAITPEMPSVDEAVRLAAQPPSLLGPLQRAHRESKLRGWTGVPYFEQNTMDQPAP